MKEFTFQALGTHWSILVDGQKLQRTDQEKITRAVQDFENRFSRFIPESEVNQFKNAKKGTYEISVEFAEMLQKADELRGLTEGVFNPTVGRLLEGSGYDNEYTFVKNDEKIKDFRITEWTIEGKQLSLQGGASFDLGGIGKGYCIDLVASILQENGYEYFLVEAGGDMLATSKANGSPYEVALEWPGKPELAFGTISLLNSGLAVSDVFRRQWKDKHHIMNPKTKKPVQQIIGCAASAKTAFDADCMTSALFLSSKENFSKIQNQLKGEYVVITEDQSFLKSPGWQGFFFE